MNPEDVILGYYKRKKDVTIGRAEARFDESVSPFMLPGGLGDTVMLTDVFGASGGLVEPYSQSGHFYHVMSKVPGWCRKGHKPTLVDIPSAYHVWNLGAGHLLQRVRRMFSLPIDRVPRGCISASSKRVPGRVVLHMEPGVHSEWQRVHIHTRARRVYPENKDIIRRFAKSRGDLEWTSVGIGDSEPWASRANTSNAAELIEHIASCEWFVGIISGPMHVASALGVKCIVIVNFPDPKTIILPTLKVLGTVEEEWFYPQNVHLHQDGSGPLVPKFSARTLARAFDGGVYPFWKTDWCGLMEK